MAKEIVGSWGSRLDDACLVATTIEDTPARESVTQEATNYSSMEYERAYWSYLG